MVSHTDIVIFLCDSLTLPELRKSLLKYPAISICSTSDQQGSSKQIENDDTLTYEIDNKYYSATVSFLLLTLPTSISRDDENLRKLEDLISNEETNKVFVWAFFTPTAEKVDKTLHRQILPPKPVLDVFVNSQTDRELNYALHLSESANAGVDSVEIEETFDELGWEYLVHSYSTDQTAPSGSTIGQYDQVLPEGKVPNSDERDEEEVEEQGIDVILAALQTVMWQGMRRKPKSTFNRAPLQIRSDTPILSGEFLENIGSASPGETNWAVGDQKLVERRRNVLAEDADSSKRMEDELEAWLGKEPDTSKSTAESSSIQGRLSTEGFDDDFGPFETSIPGSLSRPEMHPEVMENLADELDFDLEVNLESILSQLSQTREDLRNVDDEDERRVRAGREVNRILGMMGMDLGDEAGIDGSGGNDSP